MKYFHSFSNCRIILGLLFLALSMVAPAQNLYTVTVAPSNIVGGATATGTVTLTGAAAAEVVVALTSFNGAATVPANVIVPSGASSATFSVSTTPVSASVSGKITAAAGGVTKAKAIAVVPPTLLSLKVNVTSVVGGSGATGTITLNGPAPSGGITVGISTSSSFLHVPASGLVTAGSSSATVPIESDPVAANSVAQLTATLGSSRSANIIVKAPLLQSVTTAPSYVYGGTSSVGTVLLGSAAPEGLTVSLSSDSSCATPPATVTFSAGTTSASFSITTTPVSPSTAARVTASLNGLSRAGSLQVRAPLVTDLAFYPAKLYSGWPTEGTVTLGSPAPSGGLVVSLASATPGFATLPPSMIVPAGATTGTFTLRTGSDPSFPYGLLNISAAGLKKSTITVLNNGLNPRSPWPKAAGDGENPGSSSVFPGSISGQIAWTYTTKGSIEPESSPVFGAYDSASASESNGITYISSTDSYLYAIGRTGRKLWAYLASDNGLPHGPGTTGAAAVGGDGTIYVNSGNGNLLHAVNKNGTRRWVYPLLAGPISNPTIGPDGTIYVQTAPTLYALYPDGTLRWSKALPGSRQNPVAITRWNQGSSYAVVMAGDRALAMLSPTGSTIWRLDFGNNGAVVGPVLTGGSALVTLDGRLTSFSLADGSEQWATMVSAGSFRPAVNPFDGTIYVATNGQNQMCAALNPDGSLRFRFGDTLSATGSPTIGSDGTVYFPMGNCVKAFFADGSLKWTMPTGVGYCTSVALSDGLIVFGCQDRKVYAIK